MELAMNKIEIQEIIDGLSDLYRADTIEEVEKLKYEYVYNEPEASRYLIIKNKQVEALMKLKMPYRKMILDDMYYWEQLIL